MGFFSTLLSAAAPILGTILGAPAAPAPAARVVAAATVPTPVQPRQQILATVPQPTTIGAARAAGVVSPGLAAGITAAALARGGMKNRLQTIVQTIAPDGTILESIVREGQPFLMRSDFVIAKRVRKLITKAKNKIAPSKREESEQTKLMKAVVSTATRRVLTGPECPPKC